MAWFPAPTAQDPASPRRICPWSHRHDGDGVRIGLAVVPGVEQPHPGGQLGRDVDHVLADIKQPLSQGTTGTVGTLDRRGLLRPRLDVTPHRRVPGLVGSEPALPEQPFVVVDDLDRRR